MIENREAFLTEIARRLGRDSVKMTPPKRSEVNHLQWERLADLSACELAKVFMEHGKKYMFAESTLVRKSTLVPTLKKVLAQLEADKVQLSDDDRLYELGVTPASLADFDVRYWDGKQLDESIFFAQIAKVGVVWAEYGTAESGSVILFSSEAQGGSLSLLPESTVFVIPKSRLLPRPAQLCTILNDRLKRGERLPSAINIVGGPSSTADIELVKVIGVHGPVKVRYLIVEDL